MVTRLDSTQTRQATTEAKAERIRSFTGICCPDDCCLWRISRNLERSVAHRERERIGCVVEHRQLRSWNYCRHVPLHDDWQQERARTSGKAAREHMRFGRALLRLKCSWCVSSLRSTTFASCGM